LKAFAAPAANVPPIKVAIETTIGGVPWAAKNSDGRVVTNKSSTTRNFINAIYGAILFTFTICHPTHLAAEIGQIYSGNLTITHCLFSE
jgi:fructose-specific phosphotransferase system IIC component